MSENDDLEGVSVLVTRPAHQQHSFSSRLQAMRANVVSLPCLEIRWLDGQPGEQLAAIENGQILIFTSPNAVLAAHRLRAMPWQTEPTPPATKKAYTILAIGPATAAALHSHGMQVTHAPLAPYNSEALLASAALQQINLQKVSIIKGRGGRSCLEDQLKKSAGCVETIEVYERTRPHFSQDRLDAVFLKSALDIVTITSNEALQNLVDAVDKPLTERHKERLLQLPLIVNSQRGARLAKDLCFQSHVLVAPAAGDTGQLDALKLWNSSYRFTL